MKKIILTAIGFVILGLSANATTMVTYNVAGAPTSITNGIGLPISAQTYSRLNNNAGYRTMHASRPNHYGMRNLGGIPPRIGIPPRGGMRPLPPMAYRTAGNYNYIYQPQVVTTNTQTPVQTSVSRLNKNYSINTPKKTYTQNGVTYYN